MSILFMVLQIGAYGLIYMKTGLSTCKDCPVTTLDYFYFSTMTWTTVGFGDFTPNNVAKGFAMAEAIFGYIFMGFFLGMNVSLLLSTFKENEGKPPVIPTDPEPE